MVQLYVAPVCAGIDAALPLEASQTVDGAVMTAVGFAAMATTCESLLAQPFAVTVTLRDVEPEDPAVNVMDEVPAPPVIVPFVIDQA